MISDKTSRYTEYLPSILRNDDFLGRFILAFEQILSGLPSSHSDSVKKILTIKKEEANPPGFEEIIDHINNYFSSNETPDEFLPWLASWVSLSLREDWSLETKRTFIQQIVSLYQWRGTKTGLETILKLYLKILFPKQKFFEVEIIDDFPDIPHYFQVKLNQLYPNAETYLQMQQIVQAIIEQEKPMDTFYALQIKPKLSADYNYSFQLLNYKKCKHITVRVDNISVINDLTPDQDYIIQVSCDCFGTKKEGTIKNKKTWTMKYEKPAKNSHENNISEVVFSMSNGSEYSVSGVLTIDVNPYHSAKKPPTNEQFFLSTK